MINDKLSISIFFPFLNDWGTVGSLISLAISTVSKITPDWEVLIINDGSTKENREALGMVVKIINTNFQSPISNFKKVRIIDHKENRGYGGALRSGFDNATKDLIFYTDCDAQYDPRELSKLFIALKPDTGMVNGFKIKRNDPLYRTVMGRLYHHTVRFLFDLPIRDTDCDFRLIRKKVLREVRLFESTGTICTELVKKIDHAGYKIEEVPVHHYWRTSGKSQFFNFKRLYKTATNLLKLWWKLMIVKNYQA
jgi:glycosyltransferase involved in cell wall biosynthesis